MGRTRFSVEKDRAALRAAGLGRVVDGFSEAEWVARWVERPDLLDDLLDVLHDDTAVRRVNKERR